MNGTEKRAELLIKNGYIMDPATGQKKPGNLAVAKGRILSAGDTSAIKADMELDVQGGLICPGLIDSHTHVYSRGTSNGAPADLYALPTGITGLVDAGSSGSANCRGLIDELKSCMVKSRILLNISPCGMVAPTQIPESIDTGLWDIEQIDRAVDCCGELFAGFKMRVNAEVAGDAGPGVIDRLTEVAERYAKPVTIHVTGASFTMGEIAKRLRPGDVFCHVFHGTGDRSVDGNRHILRELREARERGVIFDAASGQGNLSYEVAIASIEDGFLPDIISSDMTLQNWHNPIAGTLIDVMNKFLAMGMLPEDVLRCVTSAPAEVTCGIGSGRLAAGAAADIAILDWADKACTYTDKFRNTISVKRMLVPRATILNGQLLYRAADLRISVCDNV